MKYAYINGKILDGTKDMQVKEGFVILTDNDKIEDIVKAGTDWLDALRNQKAVYLITDTSNGKMYVGSATAQYGMLLQRWTNYIDNGHGGNVELKYIVDTKGFDYIKANFQYSVLENYNARMDDNYILSREKWWKDTLCTRQFGYNKN